ncbi:MAG: protein BatD, partial [Sodaliphilus sp.]
WLDTWAYWLALLLPFAIFTGILVYYRKLVKERANVQLMRVKRAGKVAQKRLKQAKQYMDQNLDSQFYAEVLTALWGYLSDKLGIPVSELSKDNIDAELEKYGVGEALRSQLLQLLEQCEYAQYTPELSKVNKKSVFEEAAKVMEELENVKRIKPSAK